MREAFMIRIRTDTAILVAAYCLMPFVSSNGAEPTADAGNNLPQSIAQAVAALKKVGGKVELNAESTEVTSIDLSLSKATDSTLAHVKAIATLKSLDLSGTRIGNAGLLQLSELANLTSLNVFACPVSDTGIEALRKKLANVVVSQELTPKFREAAIESVRRINGEITMTDDKTTSISLRDSKATDETLRALPAFADLESLSLEYLPISNGGLEPLRHLKKLRHLNLSLSEPHAINDAGLEHIKGLTTLESLDLEGATITDAGLRKLTGLKMLKELWLFGNVTDAGMITLQNFPDLHSLWLYCPRITDTGFRHLKEHKLTLLEIGSFNGVPLKLSGQALAQIGSLRTLEQLNVRDAPKIDDASLIQLKQLVNLTTLQCEGTGITAQGIEDIKRYLPKLTTTKP